MPPKRPEYRDDYVLAWAVPSCAAALNGWLEQAGEGLEQSECEAIIARLFKNYCDFGNGYKIAKQLESNEGIDPDAELVEVCDGFMHSISSAQDKCIADWIEAYQVKPKFKVGDKVTFKRFKREEELHAGEITQIDSKTGKYFVFSEELGHVREGLGSHAVILPWEEVEVLNEA